MAYSTLNDILERIDEAAVIELTDDASAGLVDQTKIDGAIARADKEIDAWCGGRYAVPFVTVPAIITELSADMAVYFLYVRRVDEVPAGRKDAYQAGVKLLEKISKGQISLGVDPLTAPSSSAGVETVTGNRVFDADSLSDY